MDVYGRLLSGDLKPYVKLAVPTVVGDTYQGKYRIVGTETKLFGVDEDGNPLPPDEVMEYKPDQRYAIDQGRVFAPTKFEAIIGSDLPHLTDLRIGSIFQATHGMPLPGETPDIHAEKWKVVAFSSRRTRRRIGSSTFRWSAFTRSPSTGSDWSPSNSFVRRIADGRGRCGGRRHH